MSVKLFGVDISTYNNVSSYSKLADAVDFAIIRCGFGNSVSQIDNRFKKHIEGCIKAGVKGIGIYHFSYSRSVEEAKKEAKVCLELISPYKDKINMFVAYDWEYDSYSYCVKNGVKPTRKLMTDMANAFCKVIKDAGYTPAVYTNLDYANNRFIMSSIPYDIWMAQYNSTCQYKGKYTVWQYSSSGKVAGIDGRCDVNYCYKDYFSKEDYTTMKKGDKNLGVYALKQLLNQLHTLGKVPKKLADDSVFGDGTEADVKAVQKLAGLSQTGVADEKTVKACYTLITKFTKDGDVNHDGKVNMEDVVAIQKDIAGL